MAKKQITWEVSPAQLCCAWKRTETESASFLVFNTGALPGKPGNGIFESLWLHGLKQKLADSISGMSKNGYSVLEQRSQMAKVWKTLVSGKWSVRKPKEKGFSRKEISKKLAGMGLTEEQMAIAAKIGLL